MTDSPIVSTEQVFNGKLFAVEVCQIRLPDGTLARRDIIRHHGAVAIVPVDDAGNVVLVRQYRAGADRMMLEIPAGLLNPGEDPAACAERELQEEIGCKPGRLQALGGFYVAAGYTSEYIHLFAASQLSESHLVGDADEFLTIEHIPYAAALTAIENGTIDDSKTIIGLLRARGLFGV
jgi:ADP-ribose pyrophosphatase